MNNKNGFTFVEILAIIAILAVLAVGAFVLVNNTIIKQKVKLGVAAEKTIGEAAVSYFINNGQLYLVPCTNSSGNPFTITEAKVESLNNRLRTDSGYTSAATNEDKVAFFKQKAAQINSDSTFKAGFNSIISVKDNACYKAISVGELIDLGFVSDGAEMCERASIVIVYRKITSTNSAGEITSVQERKLCTKA